MSKQQKQLADLQAQLLMLGESFSQRLKDELPQLADKAELLQKSSYSTEQQQHLQALRDQLHKLAGSAGTFSFTDLGEQARILELQTQQLLNSLELQQDGIDTFISDIHLLANAREGANKRGNSSRLTQSFHFFMFEPFFIP
ncbi:Hpt domain-containing protein [Aeromonas caviae]|uniref:Hpt domain-containing protein n=1 Tax=Aeromonas caviae TaxID=648 RepID=UPI0029D9E45E|nr:Hpt domain-containing protein [Aeromonas caviae]MDX7685696.1 Hpt domain-containing protein [Aeromonas caviae]